MRRPVGYAGYELRTGGRKSDVRGEVTTNVLRLYDTESNFSRYAKIRKNARPERERNGLESNPRNKGGLYDDKSQTRVTGSWLPG